MEITTSPRPPAPTPWGRLLLCLVLFAPVTLLVLLPIGLGFERYVMTGHSMEGSIDRGSVAFERIVPVSDLRVGDVITYERPVTADGPVDGPTMVTHRVVAIGPEGIRTRGDAEQAVDPWVLQPDDPTVSRVEFVVPWVGWAYLVLLHPTGWVLVVASGVALVALTRWRARPRAGSPGPDGVEGARPAAAATPEEAPR